MMSSRPIADHLDVLPQPSGWDHVHVAMKAAIPAIPIAAVLPPNSSLRSWLRLQRRGEFLLRSEDED
jgi:hypothetical protein